MADNRLSDTPGVVVVYDNAVSGSVSLTDAMSALARIAAEVLLGSGFDSVEVPTAA